MTNTNNPMNRKSMWASSDHGFRCFLEYKEYSDGKYITCEDVTNYVHYLQEQGLPSEEILNKIVEELS